MAWWNLMLASEYSPILRGDLVLRELVDQRVQLGDLRGARVLGGKPRRHALERRPHRDHVEDLGLGLAHDEDAAARDDPDEALLVELRQRLAQRRAADAEALRQIALVEPQLGLVGVDVHVHDGGLERIVGARLQAQAFADRGDLQLGVGHVTPRPSLGFGYRLVLGIPYATLTQPASRSSLTARPCGQIAACDSDEAVAATKGGSHEFSNAVLH